MSKYLTIPNDFSGDDYYRFLKVNLIIKEIIIRRKIKKITVVDIGSGNGYLMKYIKEKNSKDIEFEFIGIDKYVTEKSFEFRLINQDVEERINLPDQFADIIIGAEIIEHISNTDGLIEEVYRILKKDGDAIITTPNLSSYFNRFLLLFGYQPYHSEVSNKESGFGLSLVYKVLGRSRYGNKTAGHLRMFTLRALRDFIEFHGFKIVKYYPVYFSSFRKDNNRKIIIKTFFAFDKMISSTFPSLATGLIVHFKKK
jgi:2-polyprenyl-3-methyl-5-hydroxy-6-metoxy-1,4-benzoquinol methylase